MSTQSLHITELKKTLALAITQAQAIGQAISIAQTPAEKEPIKTEAATCLTASITDLKAALEAIV